MKILLKIVLLFFLFVSIISNSKAQSDFRPGNIIINELDTIYGFIDFRDDSKSHQVCAFKKDLNSDVINYKPGEIFSYQYSDGKLFVSKTFNNQKNSRALFYEYLFDGIVDLYYLRGEDCDHYFLEKENVNFQEITNKDKEIYIKGKRFLVNVYDYKSDLMSFFSDNQQIQKSIEATDFKHKSLISLIKQYHILVSPDKNYKILEKKPPLFKPKLALLYNFSNSDFELKYSNYYATTSYSSEIEFKRYYNLSLGLSLNIEVPRICEGLSLEVESCITDNTFNGYHNESLYFGTNYIKMLMNFVVLENSIGIKYTFSKKKISPTIMLAGKYNRILKNESIRTYRQELHYYDYVYILTDSNIHLPKEYLGWTVGLGLNHKVKEKLFFYQFLYSSNSNLENSMNLSLKSFGLKVGVFI